jgi:hypothetical protein
MPMVTPDRTVDLPTLGAEWLGSRLFAFYAGPDRNLLASSLRFERNGRISGYRHPNESAWRIEADALLVLRDDGVPSCIATLMRDASDRVVLAGRYLFSSDEIIHRFEELPGIEGRPAICSFDLFDTLVARRCHDPIAIFHRVEIVSGVANFAEARRTVESELFDRGDYALNDIYQALGTRLGLSADTLKLLRALELAEEWDNLFPITEMIERVGPDDIIVSDMYLPTPFLRRVLEEKCKLGGRTLQVSCHGKRHGTVWPSLQTTYMIMRHHGDNVWSDVEAPRRVGIDTEHVELSAWTTGEQILRDVGLAPYAAVIREARLRCYHPDPLLRLAQLAQFNVNLPVHVLAGLALLQTARVERADTLLMCSRDCNLWVGFMRWLSARTSPAPAVRYFESSRVLLLSDSLEYTAYFLRMRGPRTLLVDVSGTGRSVSHFLGHVGAGSNTRVFLLAFAATPDVADWVADLAPPRDDVIVHRLTERAYDHRIAIELLNTSSDERSVRAEFTGRDIRFEREASEFGPESRAIIAAMRAAYVGAMRLFRHSAIRDFPDDVPIDTLRSAGETILDLTDAYAAVFAPLRRDVDNEESHIVDVARSERQRNAQASTSPQILGASMPILGAATPIIGSSRATPSHASETGR